MRVDEFLREASVMKNIKHPNLDPFVLYMFYVCLMVNKQFPKSQNRNIVYILITLFVNFSLSFIGLISSEYLPICLWYISSIPYLIFNHSPRSSFVISIILPSNHFCFDVENNCTSSPIFQFSLSFSSPTFAWNCLLCKVCVGFPFQLHRLNTYW